MSYKYLDNAVKSIKYYLNSAYSHGYSDGKEHAKIEYLKHGKATKIEILSDDEFLGELNDLVFLTREEAEKKLEELKNEI